MYNYDLKVRVFFEGIKIDCLSLSLTFQVNIPTVGTIVIPYVESAKKMQYGTHVLITYEWSDGIEYVYFEGEVSGVQYTKNGINKSILIYIVDARSYLNIMPSKYLSFISDINGMLQRVNSEGKEEYSKEMLKFLIYELDFYNISSAKAIEEITEKYLVILGKANSSTDLSDYFYGMIWLLKGCGEPFFVNNERRYSIMDNNIVDDSSVFSKIVDASNTANILNRAFTYMVRENSTVIDELISELNKYGFIYTNNPSPCEIEHNIVNNEKNKRDKSVKGLNQFILTNNFFGYMPPACNLIKVNRNDDFTVTINPPSVTGIKTLYQANINPDADPNTWSLKEATSPKNINDLIKNVSKNITGSDRITNDEKIYGIRRIVDRKEYFFSKVLSNEKDGNSNVFMQQQTNYEYAIRKYRTRSFSIAKKSFIPTIVTGLPTIIHDVDSNEYLYALINTYSVHINLESGIATTEINGSNVNILEQDFTVDVDFKVKGLEVDPLLDKFSYKKYNDIGIHKLSEDYAKEIKRIIEEFKKKKDNPDEAMKLFATEKPKIKTLDFLKKYDLKIIGGYISNISDNLYSLDDISKKELATEVKKYFVLEKKEIVSNISNDISNITF